MPDRPGALVITELMVDPKQLRDADGEWFELWNPGDEPFDLAGCVLADGSAQPHSITVHRVIDAHAFVSVARTAEPGFDPDLTATFSLSNDSDTLALICRDLTIDRVDYAKTAGFQLVAGTALSLDPAHFNAEQNDRADAWCLAMSHYASDSTDYGSPGRENPTCMNEEDASVLLDASDFEKSDPRSEP